VPNPFASLFDIPVPMNQLDALPLISTAQFQSGGAYGLIMGGTVLKYWEPAVVGIDGAIPALLINKYAIVSNWLDLSPCKFFALTILRSMTDATHTYPGYAAGNGMLLQVQYKQTAAENPAADYEADPGSGSIDDVTNGIFPIVNTRTAWHSINVGTAPKVQRFTYTLSPDTGGGTMFAKPLAFGPWVRFLLDWSSNNPLTGEPAGAHSTYSMSMLGSS